MAKSINGDCSPRLQCINAPVTRKGAKHRKPSLITPSAVAEVVTHGSEMHQQASANLNQASTFSREPSRYHEGTRAFYSCLRPQCCSHACHGLDLRARLGDGPQMQGVQTNLCLARNRWTHSWEFGLAHASCLSTATKYPSQHQAHIS